MSHQFALLLIALLTVSLPAAAQSPPKKPADPKSGASTATKEPREIVLPNRGGRHGMSPYFTPDGASLLWYDGKGVAVWDLAQEKVVATIDTPGWQSNLSPDGRLLANDINDDGGKKKVEPVVKVFEVATQKELFELTRPAGGGDHEPGFRSCGFDAKGAKLYTRTDKDLQVWDTKTGKLLRRIKTPKPLHIGYGTVHSPDGRYFIVLENNGPSLCVFDTQKETLIDVNVPIRELGTLLGRPKGGLICSPGSWNFSPDSKTIYFTEQMNCLYAELPIAQQAKLTRGAVVPGLLFANASPDGTRLVASFKGSPGQDKGDEPERKSIRVLDRKTLKELAVLGPFQKAVSWYAISPDNRWVYGSSVGETRLWDFGEQPKPKK